MEIKDVENLAELARLELSNEEKRQILKDMDSILGYVRQIEEVDLKEIAPAHDLPNVWREDTAENRSFNKDLIVGQFPDSQDGFLKVKKIL